MSIYNLYRTDAELEKSGIVLDFGSGGKIRIARAGGANERFQKRFMVLTKPHRREIQHEMIDPKLADKLLAQAYAETVVLGWEGIEDAEGKALAFNVPNCIKLFTDLPDLFLEVRKAADNSALFRQEMNEADAKN